MRRGAAGLAAMAVAAFVAAVGWFAAQALEARRETALGTLSTLRVDYRLTPDGYAAVAPRGRDFGVDSDGVVFVPTSRGAVALGELGEEIERAPGDIAVDSLAVGQDDSMLTVANGYLGVLGEDGVPAQGVPLPYADARVAPSSLNGVVYLFGGRPADARLYQFFADGGYRLLAQSDAPIVGVADTPTGVVIATARHVARLTPSGLDVVFKAPDDPAFGPIVSVAAAPDGLIFVATGTRVYAVLGAGAISIVNDSGGALRWRDGRLHVLDPKRRLLYALSPADRSMFREAQR